MNIAILYICTGKYNQFFAGFYESAKKYFMVDAEKTFYVWTDDDSIGEGKTDVEILHKECAGFPMDSLLRFETFLTAKEEILKRDYVYFFNANTLFLHPIGKEVLPDSTGLVAGVWEKNEKRWDCLKPYERRKDSTAYIPPFDGPYHYVGGFLNGGTTTAFIKMVETLTENTRIDLEKDIIAVVHDESHLNAYFHKHKGSCLPYTFCRPEEWGITNANKIMLRDKVKLDPYFNKGRKHSITANIVKVFAMVWHAVRWYLYI